MLNLTEENKKQEPWVVPKQINFIKKMIPKNPGTIQKDIQRSGSTPIKVPKIMAHPRITTYASYPPPPPPPPEYLPYDINQSIYITWFRINTSNKFVCDVIYIYHRY